MNGRLDECGVADCGSVGSYSTGESSGTRDEALAAEKALSIEGACFAALYAHLDASGQQLLRRLDEVHAQGLVIESDRILAVVGRLCLEYEAPDLFERISPRCWTVATSSQVTRCVFSTLSHDGSRRRGHAPSVEPEGRGLFTDPELRQALLRALLGEDQKAV